MSKWRGSNADEWHLFLSEHLDNRATSPNGLTYVAVQIAEMLNELEAWRECALYDAMMSGPIFKGWDRSALDRCRKKYLEGSPEDRVHWMTLPEPPKDMGE